MVPVDLSVRGSRAQDPALLIDIDVGKVTKTRSGPRATTSADEAPLQLLVLTPDGRLIVRSAEEDAGDQEWQKRYHEWKQWVTELEIGKLQKQDSVFDRRGN